jgi:hypothetical protein
MERLGAEVVLRGAALAAGLGVRTTALLQRKLARNRARNTKSGVKATTHLNLGEYVVRI